MRAYIRFEGIFLYDASRWSVALPALAHAFKLIGNFHFQIMRLALHFLFLFS